MTKFLDDPIQCLLDRCDEPVVQIDLFTPGIFQTVISGQQVNDFVYSQHDLWDYTKGREAFRAAFGSTYLTLLSGQEYHTKQKEIQKMLRTDVTDEQFTDRIKFHLFNRYGKTLSFWSRMLAIDLIWTSLFPCTPVSPHLISEFEELFVAGIGLTGSEFDRQYYGPEFKKIYFGLKEVLGAKDPLEFADRALPFIAGIRALAAMIEWTMLYAVRGEKYSDIKAVQDRPPFLLFPLYPAKDFILDWKKFEVGKLIFHAFVLPQLRGIGPVNIYGGGVHKCPGRHLVHRFLELLAIELLGRVSPMLEDPCLDYRFDGLLVPKFEHRFL